MDQEFKKRSGTTDRGKDFEHLYMASLILKLTKDDSVEDFFLSSNDEKFGAFDDIAIEVKYVGKEQTETYAIQLKQSKNKILGHNKLTKAMGNFSIPEYYQSYEKTATLQNSVKMILLTNWKASIPETIQVNIGDDSFDVAIAQSTVHNLFNTSSEGCCYNFTTEGKLGQFFTKFCLYTDQADVNQLAKGNLQLFRSTFGPNEAVFGDYCNFITNWSIKEGKKLKLNKTWMKQVIATCVLTPFIKPLAFSTGTKVSQNTETFREAVSKFNVTLLQNDSFTTIKNLWLDVLDDVELPELNKLNQKYQIISDWINSKDVLTGECRNISKLLWLSGKCPLVVEKTPEVCKALSFVVTGNFIVLCSPQTKLDDCHTCFKEKTLFRSLDDLKQDKKLLKKIANNFSYSLEGQQAASWKELLQYNRNLPPLVTTDKLVTMIDRPLLIGKQEEAILPPCHIQRNLTGIFIDSQFLKERDKGLIVVTQVKNFKAFIYDFKDGPAIIIDNIDSLPKVSNKDIIYVSSEEISRKEFDELCLKYPTTQKSHQFRYVDKNCLEWVRSKSDLDKLRKFRHSEYESDDKSITESTLFVNNENLTIVCANSGMGKSTLMKSLKSATPSTLWTILIYVRNHALYFRKRQVDMEDLQIYILKNCRKCGELDQEVFKTLLGKKQLQIIWDGLDEVSDECFHALLDVVEKITKSSIKQWITSRINQKEMLEDKFNIFARDIGRFSENEQKLYVKTRLNLSDNDLVEIFQKIKTNIEEFSNNDILGIPLQIYMLTELLYRNRKKFSKLLDSLFTIVDLYENFIEEKFKIYFEEKNKYDLTSEKHYDKCKKKKKNKIDFYKEIAAEIYLGTNPSLPITNKKEIIKIKGDKVGLISRVSQEDIPEFIHNSYGEYFAGLYLSDNLPFKANDKTFIFNEKFNNIRFFLDLMLARNCKAHIAVMYKNCALLDECTEKDLNIEDEIGRCVLELACAWSKNYNPQIIRSIHDMEEAYRQNDSELNYTQISNFFETIKNRANMCEKKLLLLLPFVTQTYFTLNFRNTVVYYGICFDYDIFVFTYLKQVQWNTQVQPLYDVAVRNKAKKCIQKFLSDVPYSSQVLKNVENFLKISSHDFEEVLITLSSSFDMDEIFRFDCSRHSLKHAKFLLEKGANPNVLCEDQRLPIHYACENVNVPVEIVQLLVEKGAKLNQRDANGRVPLHYACENLISGLKIVQLLLENDANQNVQDGNGLLPIHCACKNLCSDFERVQLLIEKGAKLDLPDGNGCCPIHYACGNSAFGFYIVQLLIEKQVKLEIPDKKGRLPIHYACEKGNFKTMLLLIDGNVNLNTPDGQGRLPIHYACKYRDWKMTKLLIDKKSKLNFPDVDGRLPIHYACENSAFAIELVHLLIENNVKLDVSESNGRLPIHYACEKNNFQMTKLLIEKRCRLDMPDGNGCLPIHLVCQNGNFETIKLLIDNNSKLDVSDRKGRFPIHYACSNCGSGFQLVQLLIEQGVTLEVPDRDGRLPIHYACENFGSGFEIVQLLMKKNVRLDVPDAKGRLPIHYARENFIAGQQITTLMKKYIKERKQKYV